MFKNYFKVALRSLGKHRGDTVINLVGLCVAFTTGLLLLLSVYYEFSYDNFHKNAANIYHLYFSNYTKDQLEKSSSMPIPMLPALKSTYPEVRFGTRYVNAGGTTQ